MNEITRFTPKPFNAERPSRAWLPVWISWFMLALGACQSVQPLSDRMESKYSLKKRKTSISGISPDGPERYALPVTVSSHAYKTMLASIDRLQGTRYRSGGNAPDGFDCSGFVQYLFSKAFGLQLPRTSPELALLGNIIPRDRLRRGDLLFFSSGTDIDHVGIYLGDNRFVHASTTTGVSIANLYQHYFQHRYAFGTRIISVK
jgi:cell wall-associated NlpC family hydrolase